MSENKKKLGSSSMSSSSMGSSMSSSSMGSSMSSSSSSSELSMDELGGIAGGIANPIYTKYGKDLINPDTGKPFGSQKDAWEHFRSHVFRK